MIFEVGKTYQHNSGKTMTILGRLKTHIWGECLIGECDSGELIPVGESEDNAVNWHEQECQYKAESEGGKMTREEAIIAIHNAYQYEMAENIIEALKGEPCEDCVSREAVLNAVKNNYRMAAIDAIEQLPPVTPKQRWIPVSERLPEDGEYLLWGKIGEYEENNYCFIGEYDSCVEEFGYRREYYDSSTLGFLDSELIEYHKVLAWMPLPEPYQEGESE